MIDNANDLKEKAMVNKFGLRKKYVNIPIGEEEYGFRLSGIGAKAVKIEKFVKYDDIMEAIDAGNDSGLEAMLKKIIEEYEPEISEDDDE